MKTYLNGKVVVKVGDITKVDTDAIVNAANSTLLGGGGVDGAIHRAGGPKILEECKLIRKIRFKNGLPTGEAVATTGGNLKAKYVIHTVGPIWYGGNNNEENLLKNAYLNSLKIAENLGAKTISFPAISTGIYGFPKEKAALIVSNALKEYFKNEINENKISEKKINKPNKEKIEKVFLIFYSKNDYELFIKNCDF